MSEQLRKQIDYTVVCVNEFARRFNIDSLTAFEYLKEYKGLEFLDDHYEIEHCLSLADAIDDLTLICSQNGGALN